MVKPPSSMVKQKGAFNTGNKSELLKEYFQLDTPNKY